MINPTEKRAKEKELDGDQDSQIDYDANDDVDNSRINKQTEDDTQSEVTENEERSLEIKARITQEFDEATETQEDMSQPVAEESLELARTSAEPELKDDLMNELYLKKVKIETPPVTAEVDTKALIEYDETSAGDGSEDVYRYPLPEIPCKYEEMKKEFQQSEQSSLKYLLSTPIDKLSDYPFFVNNYEEFHRKKGRFLQVY